ncbi:MAG: Mth938-like domain-containing protein [Steroidobacteraceae bacterium]
MKLHEHRQSRMNLISSYGDGEILINGQRLTAPCIIAPGFLHQDWIGSLSDLTLASIEPVWALQPRILLLGAAQSPAAAARALRPPLAAKQLALEAMELGAACRTYNVLAQEDRSVAALLFP